MRKELAGYGIAPNPAPSVLWNFEKFLIGRDGQVIDRFAPDVPADDAHLRHAVNAALASVADLYKRHFIQQSEYTSYIAKGDDQRFFESHESAMAAGADEQA